MTVARRILAVVLALLVVMAVCAPSARSLVSEYTPAAGGHYGTVLLIHGGGWAGSPQATTEGYNDLVGPAIRSQGWDTLAVDYRTASTPGHELDGWADVQSWAQGERARRPGKPLCAWGWSSGGHYALLLAASGDVNCALAEAPPTNTEHWEPTFGQSLANGAFGPYKSWVNLFNYSKRGYVAIASAYNDLLIGWGQVSAYATGHADYTNWLRDGSCAFTHQSVDCADRDQWYGTMAWTLLVTRSQFVARKRHP